MGDTLIKIIDELTALRKDVDLFYLEMPLNKSGLWVNDASTPSRFNGTGYQDFEVYYRGMSKSQAIANTKYIKTKIDGLSGSQGTCRLNDGTTFKLTISDTWDYLEKDAQGYFVFGTTFRLFADEPTAPDISA